jgi:hypothetical protein
MTETADKPRWVCVPSCCLDEETAWLDSPEAWIPKLAELGELDEAAPIKFLVADILATLEIEVFPESITIRGRIPPDANHFSYCGDGEDDSDADLMALLARLQEGVADVVKIVGPTNGTLTCWRHEKKARWYRLAFQQTPPPPEPSTLTFPADGNTTITIGNSMETTR